MIRKIIKTMRPKQWSKNVFVLAALVFDGQLFIPASLFRSVSAMALFCMISGVVYIINDIFDIESDRNHPEKCNRPIASGELPLHIALISASLLLLICFPLCYILSPIFCIVAAVYFFVNLAYSKWLKHIPLLDVLVLASGFVLRVGAGVTVIQVQRFSPWLYVVTTLLALYIGFGKRRAELTLLTTQAHSHRKVLDGYTIPMLDQLITIVSSTTIIGYSLYTFSAPNLPENHTMMLTIPFVLYGIFRYLYLIEVKKEGGAPEELFLRDRALQVTIILWGISVLLIFYLT